MAKIKRMTVPASDATSSTSEPVSAETQVYCIHGADPEVQAYAMAKYSRSSLSLKQSLAELNEQKAEKFLSTFYFQYGHRSIADLGACRHGHRTALAAGSHAGGG